MQPVRLPEALKKQLGQDSGLLVVTVEPGGPAGKGGMLQGDTVVAFDGAAVRQLDEVFRALKGLAVGSTHTLRVIRAGELKDLTVTTGERAA
jgi:S1-C subfamily serine protease